METRDEERGWEGLGIGAPESAGSLGVTSTWGRELVLFSSS